MANPVIKVWLREPRKAWRNDGGVIPRGFRTHCKRKGVKRVLTVTTRSEVVRRGWWVVLDGNQPFVFSSPQMRRLYSRVPL
ncbi:MAG: hypothetical protein WC829_00965 [Hyphomicrobium sp.]|jgi:hypothetical protein